MISYLLIIGDKLFYNIWFYFTVIIYLEWLKIQVALRKLSSIDSLTCMDTIKLFLKNEIKLLK